MIAAVLVFECLVPGSHSLKEKRRVIRHLIDRIHRRFKVSIIESDHHDLHQRTQIAVAAVHRDGRSMQQLLDSIRRTVDLVPDAEIISWDAEILEDVS